MENKKLRIGFANNLYGTPKGHSYVVRDMVRILKDEGHEIHMYRIGDNPISDEFTMPHTLESIRDRSIPELDFVNWAIEKQLDYCVFMEYNQWWDEDHDKIDICNKLGIKPIGFLVYEKLDWNKVEHYKKYYRIISPTGFQTKLYRRNGLYNAVHIPWGVDKEEIDKVVEPPRDENKIRFYHCAGSGGVGGRKNTEAIVDAYKQIQDENTELKISHLGSGVFTRKDIISFMKWGDVLVNTAKWDTIGLNTLEANMCGRPAIVVDMEPMDELVKPNINGLLVEGEETKNENVTCPAYNVIVDELAKQMSICKNKMVLDILKTNSRKFAEINFDWDKNKTHLLKLFK